MAQPVHADIDPFSDSADGGVSIGAGARDIVDIGSEWEEEDFEDDSEFDEVSGVEIIGAARQDLIGAARRGQELLDSDDFLDQIGAYNHEKVAKGIRSVTRSPATHAAIGALATAVPYGTVAAGVAEVGLLIAEGWAAVGGTVLKVVDKLNPFKKNPKRRARRKKRRASRRAKRKSRRAKRKGRAAPSRSAKKTGSFQNPLLARARLTKLKKLPKRVQNAPKAKAEIKRLSSTLKKKAASANAKAGLDLARTMAAAKRGDKKASAKLVGIQFLTSPAMTRAQVYAKGRARGLSQKDAMALGNAAAKKLQARMRAITKEAKKHPTGKAVRGAKVPNLAKVRATLQQGAAILIKKTDQAAAKRSKSGNLEGIVVTLKGTKQRGAFVNKGPKSKATKGWVVTPTGKALPGRWAKA